MPLERKGKTKSHEREDRGLRVELNANHSSFRVHTVIKKLITLPIALEDTEEIAIEWKRDSSFLGSP